MTTPKIGRSAQLLPEVSKAIDEVRAELRMGLPEFMSTDPRVVKWFHDKGLDVPGITRAGRPRKAPESEGPPAVPPWQGIVRETPPTQTPTIPGAIRLKTPEELAAIMADREQRKAAELETSAEPDGPAAPRTVEEVHAEADFAVAQYRAEKAARLAAEAAETLNPSTPSTPC